MRKIIMVACVCILSGKILAKNEISTYQELENSSIHPKDNHLKDTASIGRFYNLYFLNREKDPGKALQYLQQGLAIAQSTGNKEKAALFNYHKGYLFRMLGFNNLALTSDMQALSYYEKNNNESLTGWTLIDIGNLYFDEKVNLNMALEHFFKAENLFKKSHNDIGVIVAAYCIGLTYKEQTHYSKAIKYFQIASSLSAKINEKTHQALALTFLGQTYLLMGDSNKAQENFNASLKISQTLKDKQGMASAYSNMAEAFCDRGDTKKGMVNFHAALGLLEEVHNKLEIARTLEKMSLAAKHSGQTELAINYANRSLQVADSNYLINQQQKILPVLSAWYEEVNQPEKAFKLLQRYIKLKESSINKNARQVQLEYESQLKMQNTILEQEKINRQKSINYFLTAGLLLVGLFSYTFYSKNKALKETNKFLFEKHLALTRKEEELTDIKKQAKVRTAVNEELHHELYSKLSDLMEREKIFLNNTISLDDLSKQLNTNRTYLSQVINDRFNTNFNTYINEYRVKEAQKIFMDPASKILTIEAIAQNVGFNSKSSFNTAFKKFSGLTPTDFISMKQAEAPN